MQRGCPVQRGVPHAEGVPHVEGVLRRGGAARREMLMPAGSSLSCSPKPAPTRFMQRGLGGDLWLCLHPTGSSAGSTRVLGKPG